MNYKNIYVDVIKKYGSSSKPKNKYTENHHIIPVCLGGKNTKENLVFLPARVHILCHWLLTKIHPNNIKLIHAFSMMCEMNSSKMKRKPSIKILAISRTKKAKAQSDLLNKTKNIQFLTDEAKNKRAKSAIKNGSFKGRNNSKACPVDIYDYFSGQLIISDVLITEWSKENKIRNLNATLHADRSKPSSNKNRHHAKGMYIVKHGSPPYPPKGGTYAGPKTNQGHIGLKKPRNNK